MIKKLLGQALGKKSGLLSLISEKTGKISFKRVGSTMVIAWIVNNVNPLEMTTAHAIVIGMCLISVSLPKVLDLLKKE